MAFSGKVVLITGAASGIGAATAKHFAALGASLALTDKNLANLEKVASTCEKLSSKQPFPFAADLTNETETENLLKSVLSHYKGLNVLINNAGIYALGTIENTSLTQFNEVFNTNVRSMYHVTMLAVPHLVATKGNIVNVSSLTGLRSYAGRLAYSMSKAAIDQFTRCVAMELAPKRVRVNGVNPGLIRTNLFNEIGLSAAEVEGKYELATKTHPLGRAGFPEEVAKAIAFLASDDSSFSTGVNFPVDGGKVLA